MLQILEQTMFTIGQTPITGMHIVTVVIAGAFIAWSYLKGIPFTSDEEPQAYEHKSLNQLREPEFRHIINKYGKNLDRDFVHDKKQIGVIDREIVYWVRVDEDESSNRKEPTIIPDHLASDKQRKELSRISIYYLRDDKLMYNVFKKFFGLPQRIYDIIILPEKFVIDADALVLDKNVNLIQYAGIDTVWCGEVKNLFKAFLNKDVSEQMSENIVNFLRRVTHFDTEQAKQTQFKQFETEMERLRWGDKQQRDSSKV